MSCHVNFDDLEEIFLEYVKSAPGLGINSNYIDL
jgi:hypothetical protein